MSQSHDRTPGIAEAVSQLKCEIDLPSAWKDYFDRRGQLPTCMGDKRRFPRSYFRGTAALHCRQSFPALPRPDLWYKVYTKDVSRSGVSFLHGEQLFPGEQMTLVLPDGRSRHVEVVRCHRVQQRCFEIGATFIAGLHKPAPADTKED